ncbi:MAG: hypothetical protein OXG35_02495 [Acidobacteria bacterium]|nr:hypothetical protein [Acidobacteriota bacterium]
MTKRLTVALAATAILAQCGGDNPVGPSDLFGSSYVPSVACTGKWKLDDGEHDFEFRVVNNIDRPRSLHTFRFDYRQDSGDAWILEGTRSHVSGALSYVHLPLFESLSSPPFEWRARACPAGTSPCSDWSEVVRWTVRSCAFIKGGDE